MIRNKILFISACFLLGFLSILSQIVFFRELLSVFYGNELCLGILLCVWLLWVGLGSKLGNTISNSNISLLKNLSFWYFLLAIFSILTILIIRYSRIILNTLPGEIIGLMPILGFTLFALLPLCLILGILFVLNSRVWVFESKQDFLVTKVYLWESLGAGIGGLLGSLVLIPNLSNYTIQSWLFIAVLFFSFLLIKGLGKKVRIFFIILLGVLVIKIGGVDTHLEGFALNKLWRGLPIVKSVDSKYGNLAILKTAEQTSFYENGLILFSYPDEFSSEEAVLYAIAEHPDPRKLLLIGGGVGGTLTQALKYKDLKIDYVELDPKIVELGKVFLPASDVKSLENKRIRIIYRDGRLYVREKSEQRKEKYDLVILNLPDPYNAQLNRFYTKEFFILVKKLLSRGGIFCFRASSAENYLSPEQALYISSLYRTLSSEFKFVIVLPGSNNIFLASQSNDLTYDWREIVKSLKKKNIQATYVNEHFLSDRLSTERIEYLQSNINSYRGKINYDLKPISYFYNTVLWSAQLKSFEKPLFNILAKLNSAWFFLSGLIISFSFLIFLLRGKNFLPGLSLYTIFLVGFSSITFEISLLLTYQIFYGYIYSQVGLFLTLFMLGLFGGALYISRKKIRADFKTLTRLQFIQVLLFFFFLFFLFYIDRFYISPKLLELILGGMILFSGIIGGAEFTCANQLYIENKGIKRVGTGYAIDLFGSALSAILASVILIPLLGITLTLWLLFLLNLILLGFLFLSSTRAINAQLQYF